MALWDFRLFDDPRYTRIQEISPSSSVNYKVSLEREINIRREVTAECKEYERDGSASPRLSVLIHHLTGLRVGPTIGSAC